MEIAARYNEQGADELTFLDITATSDDRDLILHIIEAVASQVFIPHRRRRRAHRGRRAAPAQRRRGQDQLQLAAIANGHDRRPGPVRRPVHRGGHRCQAAQRRDAASRDPAGTCTATAAAQHRAGRGRLGAEMARRGAGEILLTSMDRDGTKSGFDLELTRAVSDAVPVPVIASGGVGTSTTSPTASSRAAPTPCWPPASSTTASTRSRRRSSMAQRGDSGPPVADQGQYVPWIGSIRSSGMRRGSSPSSPRKRPRRRADVRLDGPRGPAQDGRTRARGVLQSFARQAVVQGRGVRPRAAGARDPHGLRQRRAAAEGDPGRAIPRSPATPAGTAASSIFTATAPGRWWNLS